ncbi:polynucleotide kinase [Streptacidiphilus sp. 4-A2]|nr:polynucleotide kinase [Streptacidiphilus sp. 4-A2]
MKRPAVIVDLDGTLALIGDRSPYDADSCGLDAVNEPVRTVVDWAKAAGHGVLLVSGRGFQASHRRYTEMWLTWNRIPYDVLLMRAPGDARPDEVVKREIYERHIRDSWDVAFVLDDRAAVIAMWRSLGLTVFQVDDRL